MTTQYDFKAHAMTGIVARRIARAKKRREPMPVRQHPDGGLIIPATHKHGLSEVRISTDDADLADVFWTKTNKGYAASTYNGSRLYLHRIVLGRMIGRSLLSCEIADHINFDRLDCRRDNLRLSDPVANSVHRRSEYRSNTGITNVFRYGNRYAFTVQRNRVVYRKCGFMTANDAQDALAQLLLKIGVNS